MTRPASSSPEVVEAIERLGGMREEFRGSEIMAARIVGPIVILIGVFVVYWVLRLGLRFDPATLFVLGVGGLMTVGGMWTVIRTLWAPPYRLLLCQGGLIEVRGKACAVIPWSGMIGVVENRATEIEKLFIGV